MILYQLHRYPDESAGEGEQWDEWFSSLREARRRRAKLIGDYDARDYHAGPQFSIDRVELAAFSPRKLALAVLNGRGFVVAREEVCPSFERVMSEGEKARIGEARV